MPVAWKISPMRPAATLACGSMTMAKPPISTPLATSARYWMMAKISPPEMAWLPVSMRQPPSHKIATPARFTSSTAAGLRRPICTLALMMFSAMTWVASAIFCCRLASLLNARMTRMPCSRSRMTSFWISMYLSEVSCRGPMRLLMGRTIRKIAGTNSSRIRLIVTSLRSARMTPPKNSTGIVMRLPEIIDATHETVPMS